MHHELTDPTSGRSTNKTHHLYDLGRETRQRQWRDENVVEQTGHVVQKLLTGIADHGIVSLFHVRESGEFNTALFTVYFRSRTLPHLYVTLWKQDSTPSPSSLDMERRLFGVTGPSLCIETIEMVPSKGNRAIAVTHNWDMEEGDYAIVYRRDAIKEATNMPKPRSNREKIIFLREILETEVDETATEKHFGRPYSPGDTWSNSGPPDPLIHRAYWVRDLKGQIQVLTNLLVRKLGS